MKPNVPGAAGRLKTLRTATALLLELMMGYGIAFRRQERLSQELARRSQELESTMGELTTAPEARGESEGRSHAIVETAVDAIITIGERGTVQSFNPAAEQLFGYTPNEVIGKSVNILIPSPHSECHDEYLDRYLRTGEAKIIGLGREVEGRRKDGTTFPMHLAIGEVRLEDRRLFAGIIHDLTERKQVEAELQQAKEAAETASRAKSEFLANMSHEIRTPLHGILSFARFGIDKALTADSEKLLNYFQKIDMSGKRLMALLSDVLDLAKIEAGKMRFEFKPADLRTVLRSVDNEFRSLFARRNITIDYLEPDCKVLATLDEQRMAQVVRNLLSNAAKFSLEGGTIRVNVNRSDEGVEISIRDNGVGIPEEELETIFGKFVQSSKTKSGAGGTGLGLSICREIVQAHQGRIWAENHPEGGAVFHVLLPLTMDPASPQEQGQRSCAEKTEEGVGQASTVGVS